jgi:hypothetical protein
MEQEKIMKQLELELQNYKSLLGQAADTIIDEDVSKYPIFVLFKEEVELGIPVVDNTSQEKWSINASTLEEFYSRQLIDTGKVEEFKKIYKHPKHYLCLFIINELGGNYYFLPRTSPY